MQIKSSQILPHFQKKTYYYHTKGIRLIRPMTLTGTLTPILVATGLGALTGYFHFMLFIATLMTSLLIQSAVNIFNDYFDFSHGQDANKWISLREKGGPNFQVLPIYAIGLLFIAMVIGLWLVVNSNLLVLLAGVIGVLLGFLYSAGGRSLSSFGLGELIAAVTMGTIVPWTTYVIQTDALDVTIILASLPFAFLIASMILTNNIRDLDKDKGFRHTLAMRMGLKNARRLLCAFLLLPYMIMVVLVITDMVPIACMVIVFALPIAVKLLWGVKHYQEASQINIMKWAAYHHWMFGLLYALSIWLSVWIG